MSLHYEVMLKMQPVPATGDLNDHIPALGIHNQQPVASLSYIFYRIGVIISSFQGFSCHALGVHFKLHYCKLLDHIN
jgi:hypothetical protein